jgi:hypothetical protein
MHILTTNFFVKEKMQETLPMLGDGVNDERSNSQIITTRNIIKNWTSKALS